MRPLGKAVVRSGLVDDDQLSEMRRWKLPVETEVDPSERLEDPGLVVRAIQDALDSGEQVRMQDTDLDIVHRWCDPENQVEARLTLKAGDQKSTSKVIFCWTVMKEVAFPWKADGITELLLESDESYLRFTDKDGKDRKCGFVDVRELFVGDTKAFVVCTIRDEE